ncbi:hypothetical protein BC939DRAFT_445342 [Gamsiella multidivaricata]|uniref:uncharacterized protein n=1 Tax=Gamsiella multidivaricata TaxID=101098 RepID=UPI002221134B|nr:uncharacterized protein BC939DRAFT_445342 [Gamsiella multidivaricata]KAG0367953.1 hypothetical protein BGZ54_002942 [Gamsiella multidivaricata]KAI7827463.1 hypothetical protein BC939DRAFT_445342 [Gamsiella multidivaricata]
MRTTTLCLGLVALISSAVLAQEIIAPEEWFESLRLSRSLDARKLHRKNKHHHHHRQRLASIRSRNVNLNKRSTIPIVLPDVESLSSKLQKRFGEFPLLPELEGRATAFRKFQEEGVVEVPENMRP